MFDENGKERDEKIAGKPDLNVRAESGGPYPGPPFCDIIYRSVYDIIHKSS